LRKQLGEYLEGKSQGKQVSKKRILKKCLEEKKHLKEKKNVPKKRKSQRK